jgi:ketosteroid isomerase-like protein
MYCEICDDDHNPERITTIFTEDGIWEGKGIGTATGHAEIRALFEKFQSMMSFTQHMTMNPRIEVNGDEASGTWYFFGPFTFYKGNQARWQAARYVEDYRRVDGEWKIAHLRRLRKRLGSLSSGVAAQAFLKAADHANQGTSDHNKLSIQPG